MFIYCQIGRLRIETQDGSDPVVVQVLSLRIRILKSGMKPTDKDVRSAECAEDMDGTRQSVRPVQ